MLFRLLLSFVVDLLVYLWKNSSEVNIETIRYGSLTLLHTLSAEELISLCSGKIAVMLTIRYKKRNPFSEAKVRHAYYTLRKTWIP